MIRPTNQRDLPLLRAIATSLRLPQHTCSLCGYRVLPYTQWCYHCRAPQLEHDKRLHYGDDEIPDREQSSESRRGVPWV